MADGYVQVLPDNVGKKLQTFENTVGVNDVHSEAVTLVTSSGTPLIVDDVDETLVTIDFVHHEIHEGNHYTSSVYDTTVDIASPKYFRLTVPAAVYPHVIFAVSGDSGFVIQFYEDPTLDAVGSAVARINNNRSSVNTANVTVFEDSTTQAPNNDGTLLWSGIAGSGGNPTQSNSGQSGARQEFILSPSEDYLIKVTALANGTMINIQAEWYEV